MNNELIQLITVRGYEKKDGFKVNEDIHTVEIFAGVESVKRTEYYEALRSNVKASIVFTVAPDDFALGIIKTDGKKIKPSKIIYDDDVYLIIRTYRKNSGRMEITCAEVE